MSRTKNMAPIPSKMTKVETGIHPGKLWTREERMIDEKFFYLNKSTTKYAIVGLEPEFLEPIVRICDRVTGSHISIKKENFGEFTRIVSSILNDTYKLERGFIEGSTLLCGIRFYCVTKDIWKITQADIDHVSVLIHKASFMSFMGIAEFIQRRITTADTTGYLAFIKELRLNTFDLNLDDSVILTYLRKKIEKFDPGCIEYQLLLDLICYQDLFVCLKNHCKHQTEHSSEH